MKKITSLVLMLALALSVYAQDNKEAEGYKFTELK